MKSDLRQTLNAIGIAAGSCGALGRDGGTMAKPLRAGQAAASGVTAALLAHDGCTGDTEALEGGTVSFPLSVRSMRVCWEIWGRRWVENLTGKVKTSKSKDIRQPPRRTLPSRRCYACSPSDHSFPKTSRRSNVTSSPTLFSDFHLEAATRADSAWLTASPLPWLAAASLPDDFSEARAGDEKNRRTHRQSPPPRRRKIIDGHIKQRRKNFRTDTAGD